MDLANHLFNTATTMNRVAARSHAAAGSVAARPDTVFMVSLQGRVLGHYWKEDKAIVTAHRIRQSDVYRDLTWQKVTHAHSGQRQVWTCEAHGETITLVIEPRQVE